MENFVSRREFLSQTVASTASTNKKKPGEDPVFKEYANKELPFSNARTNSGTNQYTGSWSAAETLHLLRRITFGASQKSIDQLKGLNLSDAVDLLIDNPQLPVSYPVNVYQNIYPDTQGVPFGESWVYFNAPTNNDGDLNYNRINYSFKPWWIGLMINQDTHILEKITLFWANHFGTQIEDFNFPRAVWQHYATLRTHSLGNFRTLLKLITIDPHMLMFQNGNFNSASAQDENYARELQELFTIGKGPASAYTEDDVKQAAKILTGWRRKEEPDGSYSTYFNDAQHDITNKKFSSFYKKRVIKGRAGADGQLETDDLIDMLLATDEAAKYICRRLYRWFVYYVIDDATEANVITPLADIFRSNNYEIAPVLKALFKSEHFFDPLNRGCIIKSPVDFYIGFCREFRIDIPYDPVAARYNHWQHFKDQCEQAAQKIGDPPNVAGWPAYYQTPIFYQAWINSDTIQKRVSVITTYSSTYGYPIDNGYTVKIDSIRFNQQFPNPEDPAAVVANFAGYLLPQPVSDAEIANMKTILLSTIGTDHYWSDAWNAYMGDSRNATKEGVVRERLNALVSYITTLEEYQLF
jgi:uncharacterized protein (DUF1800 family)